MESLLDEISGKDRKFGKLCSEAESSYRNENYFAGLVCLFVAAELIVKFSVNQIDGNFNDAVLDARLEDIITDDEFMMITHLRETRNRLFHEDHYSLGIYIGGVNHSLDDDDTKKDLFEIYFRDVYRLVNKLI
jgi:hypothetical protein